MFERLTIESECFDGMTLKALCESCGESGCDEFCEKYQDKACNGCPIQEAFERLAAYEDSGLSPEQVQQLKAKCDDLCERLNQLSPLIVAQAEGRLVELPCKVGDTVYWFWVDSEGNSCDIVEETILYFYIDKNGAGIATKRYDGHIGHYVKDGEIVDGVRRIFLTREAAEKALGGGEVVK